MTISYKIFDRLYEWTKHPDDLEGLEAISDDLAAFDQATRDELLSYAENLASTWKALPGKEPYAGLWEAFAAEVRRADHG